MKSKYHDTCLCCVSRRVIPLRGYGRHHLFVCQNCDFVFAGKLPSPGELKEHYAHKYEFKYGPDAWVSPVTRKRLVELVVTFERYRESGRLLDVGCGNGLLLEAAQQRGWTCHGTEYSEEAIRYGEERGFEMHSAEMRDDSLEQGYFDVIVMMEVIEHLADPRGELERVTRFLRPGGLLYLTSPNFASFSRRALKERWNIIEYPAHLCYFTPATLDRMMTPLGLSRLSLETTGFSPTRFKKSLRGEGHPSTKETDADEVVRLAIETKRIARIAKALVNKGLTATQLGDALKAYYVRGVL